MKVYFYEEGLIESQEFYTDNKAQYFLFRSISSVYPLVKFEEELAEINDYCVFILSKIEDKLNTLIKDSDVHFELIKGCQLLSYLESSLNEIANWFCKERSVSENELVFLNKVRKIRNKFVHREWEQLEKHYDQFRLCEVFNVISIFFTEIEKAACNIGIIEGNEFFTKSYVR